MNNFYDFIEKVQEVLKVAFKDGAEFDYNKLNEELNEYLRSKVDWEDCEPPEPDYDYYEEREMERWEAELDRYGL